ncbi:copal-8-ol diphosphate hydratase, chloroplastic-like [Sesamum indicum]|uniref:Copal-8-ol diphosphate hydratase, chloroplastic-like n=1 Tax=Sesamum indicum TaxID=4182 RepID=A0A8M8UQZ7_SESIN|nr:copal-8-ol diphosphate hydratase, chloroplastic-like [Sesamum indicum]
MQILSLSSPILLPKCSKASPTRRPPSPKCFTSVWPNRSKGISPRYKARLTPISRATTDRVDLAVAEDAQKEDLAGEALQVAGTLEDLTEYIKKFLSSIDEGRINVSPYDTAWVALIRDIHGEDSPQFPGSLEWVAQNQLQDGSWGEEHVFSAYDRLLNTLACVVALKTWNVHPHKSQKGIAYIKENIHQLEHANAEHMTSGFEIVFPALLQRARDMGIHDLPYDAPALQDIFAARNHKLARIPKELMHKVRTSLLFSLEGLEDLEWQKLLKLLQRNGSFLFSPSSTAFAFMETKDENCLKYIDYIVQKFDGGAPNVYPIDIFARTWSVDRLTRLGISRLFESEIKNCLEYVHSFWSEKGLFCGRESEFCDVDSTSVGFMLLRLHGFNVSPDVLKRFKKDDGFSCFYGQTFESLSPIFNLYRSSQVLFPGEKILEEAIAFCKKFIHEKITSNQLLDKWLISPRFADEVKNGWEIPWYASLPRVIARLYIETYCGSDYIWVGKSLYRTPDINNDAYLELAKLDFNRCQALHQTEWNHMQEWYENSNLQELGISQKDVLAAYFLAAASAFEPERSKERSGWAKSRIISKIITSYFNRETTSPEEKAAFLAEFRDSSISAQPKKNSVGGRIIDILRQTLQQLQEGIDKTLCDELENAWDVWLMKLQEGDDANCLEDAALLVTTLNICGGRIGEAKEILSDQQYITLSNLINNISSQLSQYKSKETSAQKLCIDAENGSIKYMEIEKEMQKLVQLVYEEPTGINKGIKQTFLLVAKALYYDAYFPAQTVDSHMSKVLFVPVP